MPSSMSLLVAAMVRRLPRRCGEGICLAAVLTSRLSPWRTDQSTGVPFTVIQIFASCQPTSSSALGGQGNKTAILRECYHGSCWSEFHALLSLLTGFVRQVGNAILRPRDIVHGVGS